MPPPRARFGCKWSIPMALLTVCMAFGRRRGVQAFGFGCRPLKVSAPPTAPAAAAAAWRASSTTRGAPRPWALGSRAAAKKDDDAASAAAGQWAYRLVLLRHGESTWNRDNRYIGWTDVPLTTKGEEEASQAGSLMKRAGVQPDHVYTSYLKRAVKTAWLAMADMGKEYLPETRAWQLNERMYGLAGLTPQEAYAKHGEAQVRAWATSLTEAPPEVAAGGECDPRREADKYGALDPPAPRTESLRDVQARMVGYWEGAIQPHMMRQSGGSGVDKKPATFLLVSHANAIRALMAHLDGLQAPEEIWAFEVPRAVPIVYHFDAAFHPLRVEQGAKTKGEGMSLPSQITATVLLPSEDDTVEGGWEARLPSNS